MLFTESLKKGDLRLSRDLRNDMSRIFGPERDEALTVQANNSEQILRISFRFTKDNNKNNIEHGEIEEIK